MTRRRSSRLPLALLVVAGFVAAPSAQEPAPAPDRSLDRMRSVLAQKPLRLDMPEIEATFKIHIKAIHPMHDIFEKPAWQLDPIGWQPPPGIGGFDLMSLVMYAVKSAADAKRGHDERMAREEVQRAIAEYCAALPNANTISICTSVPVIR